jgi:hypothetical protein
VTASPGAALRRAILLWGAGDLALGDRGAALGWLLAEVIGLVLVALAASSLANTTWYLLPFVLGAGFIGLWGYQAVRAFRRAERRQGAIGPTPRGSPAAAMAWLTLPILLWGTGFWLIGAEGTSPSAVLDRFVGDWPSLQEPRAGWDPAFATDAGELQQAASAALAELAVQCRAGELNADCGQAPVNLLRDVRVSLSGETAESATAVAELVDYVKHPTSVLWVLQGTELVPVSRQVLLRLELRAAPVPLLGLELGARRWQIVSASAAPSAP